MKPLFTFLLCISNLVCFSQNSDYVLSDAIDLPVAGWNKVLLMRNGNTILLHFEPNTPVSIKIFDSTHKEIVDKKLHPNLLVIKTLDRSVFKGLFDINGESVLFFDQEIANKHSLLRLRINAMTGNIIEEKVLIQSSSMGNRTSFFILKNEFSDDYSIFCYRDIIRNPGNKIELVKYNKLHETTGIIPLDIIVPKDYSYIALAGIGITDEGTIYAEVCLYANKITSAVDPEIYNRSLIYAFIPKDGSKFIATYMRLPPGLGHLYAKTTYNSFSQNFNLLLLNSSINYYAGGGLTQTAITKINPFFLIINGTDLSVRESVLTNKFINDSIRKQTNDSGEKANLVPSMMFTNKYGITTIVSQDAKRYQDIRTDFTFMGNIGITEYDDIGKEIWGVLLHREQANDNLKGGHDFIQGIKKVEYEAQFKSTNCFENNNSVYLIYNSNTDALNNILSNQYKYEDAVCYKINRNKEPQKYYLLGKPADDESRPAMTGCFYFDYMTSTYVTLMLDRKSKAYTTHIAWCHLN